MTFEEMLAKGIVSIYDPVLKDTVRMSSVEEYEEYIKLIEK